jgi:hypothetical protein
MPPFILATGFGAKRVVDVLEGLFKHPALLISSRENLSIVDPLAIHNDQMIPQQAACAASIGR